MIYAVENSLSLYERNFNKLADLLPGLTRRQGSVVISIDGFSPIYVEIYEAQKSAQVVEQVVRPTGLVDPEIEVRPASTQVDDLLSEIRLRVKKKERVGAGVSAYSNNSAAWNRRTPSITMRWNSRAICRC